MLISTAFSTPTLRTPLAQPQRAEFGNRRKAGDPTYGSNDEVGDFTVQRNRVGALVPVDENGEQLKTRPATQEERATGITHVPISTEQAAKNLQDQRSRRHAP